MLLLLWEMSPWCHSFLKALCSRRMPGNDFQTSLVWAKTIVNSDFLQSSDIMNLALVLVMTERGSCPRLANSRKVSPINICQCYQTRCLFREQATPGMVQRPHCDRSVSAVGMLRLEVWSFQSFPAPAPPSPYFTIPLFSTRLGKTETSDSGTCSGEKDWGLCWATCYLQPEWCPMAITYYTHVWLARMELTGTVPWVYLPALLVDGRHFC